MDALTTAISKFDTMRAFSDAIGVKPPTVSQWIRGERPIPMSKCLEIERACEGAVTCEELRPDVDWRRHRDLNDQREAETNVCGFEHGGAPQGRADVGISMLPAPFRASQATEAM